MLETVHTVGQILEYNKVYEVQDTLARALVGRDQAEDIFKVLKPPVIAEPEEEPVVEEAEKPAEEAAVAEAKVDEKPSEVPSIEKTEEAKPARKPAKKPAKKAKAAKK
jgi:hypothetical protein